MMPINFILYSHFLQAHFPRTRGALSGKQPVSGVIFSQADLVSKSHTSDSPEEIQIPRPGKPAHFTLPQGKVKLSLSVLRLPRVTLPKRVLQAALSGVIAISALVSLAVVAPALYYRVFPAEVRPVLTDDTGTPLGGEFTQGTNPQPTATPRPLPPQDTSLPEGTWLIIPRIGVRTQPLLTDDPEEALLEGVWQVPGYGEAGDSTMPMILAAHRYGWQWWWKTDYWKYHSFYLLPDLVPGDIVEVISDQRKYYYEIYAGEEGEDITDYSADLILYTCKFLNSPLRHFRYARLVDMDKNTQAGLEG